MACGSNVELFNSNVKLFNSSREGPQLFNSSSREVPGKVGGAASVGEAGERKDSSIGIEGEVKVVAGRDDDDDDEASATFRFLSTTGSNLCFWPLDLNSLSVTCLINVLFSFGEYEANDLARSPLIKFPFSNFPSDSAAGELCCCGNRFGGDDVGGEAK